MGQQIIDVACMDEILRVCADGPYWNLDALSCEGFSNELEEPAADAVVFQRYDCRDLGRHVGK